ncbi:hypothetical protein Glove_177g6 [Diversispora epigaea]|uniref:Uncharacterized protein n=1 Tax=Diversispora epigaea TaxID=1348612 RepID=A0A397INB8_9GLOM|nr:hypothetical protein Glove_177g6 [Diversispora epigaea]
MGRRKSIVLNYIFSSAVCNGVKLMKLVIKGNYNPQTKRISVFQLYTSKLVVRGNYNGGNSKEYNKMGPRSIHLSRVNLVKKTNQNKPSLFSKAEQGFSDHKFLDPILSYNTDNVSQ